MSLHSIHFSLPTPCTAHQSSGCWFYLTTPSSPSLPSAGPHPLFAGFQQGVSFLTPSCLHHTHTHHIHIHTAHTYITHSTCIYTAHTYITHTTRIYTAHTYITHTTCIYTAHTYITHTTCIHTQHIYHTHHMHTHTCTLYTNTFPPHHIHHTQTNTRTTHTCHLHTLPTYTHTVVSFSTRASSRLFPQPESDRVSTVMGSSPLCHLLQQSFLNGLQVPVKASAFFHVFL